MIDNLRLIDHESHCRNCINLNKCSFFHKCKIIECKLNCGFKFHECKLDEHLQETCQLAEIDCLNKLNGCKIRFKRADLNKHMLKCCANVVQCTSFRMRKVTNKNKKFSNLKFPDPIFTEKKNLCKNFLSDSTHKDSTHKNVNDILLEQDLKSLKECCESCPLKFQRMYGYLIGLKLDPNSDEYRSSFLKYLLKTVKSRIFSDIEAENCVVFNDDLGCTACQKRIFYLETARFERLKKDRFHFDFILRSISTYEDFVENKMHLNEQFLAAYKQHYLIQNQSRVSLHERESEDELNKRLLSTNQELVNVMELDKVLKLNHAKEMPCDAFQLQYESYRLDDNHFSIDCGHLVRRDEFSEHYALYHNFLLNNAESIDHNCPFSEYGCNYFKTKYDFVFSNDHMGSDHDQHPLVANLVHNELSNQLTFRLDNLNAMFEEKNLKNKMSLLDLPFEVLYEICDQLDSLSLYCLSLTSKTMRSLCEQFLQLRGIVYPKWCKMEIQVEPEQVSLDENIIRNDTNNNRLEKNKNKLARSSWQIENYVYSFSKHIDAPKQIKLKAYNDKIDNFNQHVQNCPYRVCNKLTKPFRIFPPY